MSDVVCAGILVADTFCGPMKHLPEEGTLLTVEQMPSKVGGCAANAAIDLVKQGLTAEVIGLIGDDPEADMLLSYLGSKGVGSRGVRRHGEKPTSKTFILLVEGQDRRYIHTFGANAAFRVEDIDRDIVFAAKVFYLGGLYAMPEIDMRELSVLLADARSHGVKTVVDVVVSQEDPVDSEALARVLPHVDCFTPNEDEARILTGRSDPREQIQAFRDEGARDVIVTCGLDGAVSATDAGLVASAAYPSEALDPSGAGDAYTAGIIAAYARGWSTERALAYAAALGCSAVRAVGTTDGVYSASEAESFLREHPLEIHKMSSGSS